MRILALDSSGPIARIAALTGATPLAELPSDPQQRSAKSLTPCIRTLLAQVGWTPRQLDLIAVTQGPGSFTGLRIGVMTAKTLAYASGADVVGVNALAAIADQAGRWPVWAVLDAQREQLFAARFESVGGDLPQFSAPPQIIDNARWLANLVAGEAVTGPGLKKIRNRLPAANCPIDEQDWEVRAVTVGKLGLRQYQLGHRDDPWKLLPTYFRPSAAEEKRASSET